MFAYKIKTMSQKNRFPIFIEYSHSLLANGTEITEETFNEMLLIVLNYLNQLTKRESNEVKEYHIDYSINDGFILKKNQP